MGHRFTRSHQIEPPFSSLIWWARGNIHPTEPKIGRKKTKYRKHLWYEVRTHFIDTTRATIKSALIKADIVSPTIKGTSLQDVPSEN